MTDDARPPDAAVQCVSGVAWPTSGSVKVFCTLLSVPYVTNWVMG